MSDTAELIVESKSSQINIIIDSSVMNTFEKCPTLFKYQYVDNLRSRAGKKSYLDKGELLHIGLRHYYRMKKEGAEFDACVKEGFERMMKCTSKFVTLTEPDIQDVLTGYMTYTEHYRFENWTIVEIERPFRIILFEDAELRIIIQGRIDLMVDNGQLIIPVDHKSESRRSEPIKLDNQFMLYCYAARTNNILINKIGFQPSLKPQDKYYRKLLSYDDDNLAEWRDEFIFKVREILGYAEANHFPHRYTSCKDKYGLCIFHDVCGTPRIARDVVLTSQFQVEEPWDPFRDVEGD